MLHKPKISYADLCVKSVIWQKSPVTVREVIEV